MITKERAVYLIQKSFSSTLTGEEQHDFEEWLLSGNNQEWYTDTIAERMLSQEPATSYNTEYWQPVLNNVLQADQLNLPARRFTMKPTYWMAAAVTLLLISTGLMFWFRPARPTIGIAKNQLINVAPGHKGAMLTLADGSVITLDSLQDGQIATDNGADINLKNGALAYNGIAASGRTAYNTISTTKGRQFQLHLPDGSQVWINSASSLRYPVHFSGKERRVIITGEAYFEIAANADMPFVVETPDNGSIEVLGTSFNVNAYSDEPAITTTLADGAVRVRKGDESKVLKPGQQAQIRQDIHVINNANIQQVVAWKEGIFDFQDRKLEDVMRQLARWYDIDVVYENGIPPIEFYGEMGTNLNLSQVLDMLAGTGVKFRMEGNRKLVVMP